MPSAGPTAHALYKTKITRWEIGSTRRVDCANPNCSPDTTQQDNKLLVSTEGCREAWREACVGVLLGDWRALELNLAHRARRRGYSPRDAAPGRPDALL